MFDDALDEAFRFKAHPSAGTIRIRFDGLAIASQPR